MKNAILFPRPGLPLLICMLSCFFSGTLRAQDPAVTIHWNDTTVVSKTTPTLQEVDEVCWTYNQGRELRERQYPPPRTFPRGSGKI